MLHLIMLHASFQQALHYPMPTLKQDPQPFQLYQHTRSAPLHLDLARSRTQKRHTAHRFSLHKKAAWRPARVYGAGGNAAPAFFELGETNQERKAIQVQMRVLYLGRLGQSLVDAIPMEADRLFLAVKAANGTQAILRVSYQRSTFEP